MDAVDIHARRPRPRGTKGGLLIVFVRRRLAALLAATIAALAIAIPAASASAQTTIILPGRIQLPTPGCPIWLGLNIIPIGCVPWASLIEAQLLHPFAGLP